MGILLRYARMPAVFIPLVALACHLAFSWQGILLSDDGFILAVSRRLLSGEFPHRDFIFVRPVGSGLLHAPLLSAAGDHAIWAARFAVWAQLASIAWLWVAIAEKMLGSRFSDARAACILLVGFAFSAHNHAIMPWYTIDGLFLVTLGSYLSFSRNGIVRVAGYAIAGAAPLCKQNFLLASAFVPFASGEWRRLRSWIWLAAPSAAYAAWMLFGGAMEDFIAQMTAQTGVVRYGVWPLIRIYPMPAGVLLGYAGSSLLSRGASRDPLRWSGALLLLVVPTGVALVLGVIIGYSYFGLFGVTVGMLAWHCAAGGRRVQGAAALLGLAAITAWSTSISIGYNTPALAGGALFSALIGTILATPSVQRDPRLQRAITACLVALAVVSSALFVNVRRNRLPYELPAAQLAHELDDALPGARGIWTNERTAALLADARRAIDLAQGSPYTFVPGLPVAWAANRTPNFLPSDWPFRTEIPTDALQRRVTDALDAHPEGVVITSKVSHAAAHGFSPIDIDSDPTFQPILRYVLEHGDLVGETEYFSLYRMSADE